MCAVRLGSSAMSDGSRWHRRPRELQAIVEAPGRSALGRLPTTGASVSRGEQASHSRSSSSPKALSTPLKASSSSPNTTHPRGFLSLMCPPQPRTTSESRAPTNDQEYVACSPHRNTYDQAPMATALCRARGDGQKIRHAPRPHRPPSSVSSFRPVHDQGSVTASQSRLRARSPRPCLRALPLWS